MSTEGNDKTIYSAEDISRYHSGQMSGREMHALERAALDDPFLADALEGFENRLITEVTEEKVQLNDRLAELITGRKKRLAFPVYRVGIAAVLFLLAGSLSVVYFINKADERPSQVFVQQVPSGQKDTPTSSDSTGQGYVADKALAQDKARMRNKSSIPVRDSLSPRSEMSANTVSPGPEQALTKQRTLAKEQEAFQAAVEKPQEADPLPLVAAPSSRKAMDTLNIGETRMVPANVKSEMARKDTGSNLQEVVVVGYGTQKKKSMIGAVSGVERKNTDSGKPSVLPYGTDQDKATFEPKKGWKSLTDYFEKSIRQKLEWQDKHGEIIVGFSIDESGSARFIRVEKSYNEVLDREAVRLINEGPKWQVNAGAERLAKISIVF